MTPLVTVAVLLAMLACLIMIPFGLPGLWLIVAITLAIAYAGALSWPIGIAVVAAAVVAEVLEFVVLSRFGRAFGGSRRAFWGAIAGGMIGLFVGAPVPLVGSLIAAFAGTFVGAGVVTWFETASFERSARVGWGVLLARTVAVALKVAVAVAIIGLVAALLIFG